MAAEKAMILAQRLFRPGRGRQLALAGLLLVVPPLAVLTAFGIAPETSVGSLNPALVRETLDLPETMAAPAQAPERFAAQERVMRGDTVAALFERLGVRDAKAVEFIKADPSGRALFRQLIPGR